MHSPSRLGAQRRQKASLIRIPFRGHAESDQADSLHARGPSTNLSGLSGFRSELHARHELQEAVSARKRQIQVQVLFRLEWLFDGAFEASHESILLEVGLFSFSGEGLCGFGLFKLPLLQNRLRYASFFEAELLSVFEESSSYAHQFSCDID